MIAQIEVRVVRHGSTEYLETVDLRRRILRLPLGLDFTAEELAAEHLDTHLVAVLDGRIVGCLVMVPNKDGTVKMRQVAVEPELQGKSVGTQLVKGSEAWAKRTGFQKIELNARDSAVRFYERIGYETVGDPFVEVTILHRRMVKEIGR